MIRRAGVFYFCTFDRNTVRYSGQKQDIFDRDAEKVRIERLRQAEWHCRREIADVEIEIF